MKSVILWFRTTRAVTGLLGPVESLDVGDKSPKLVVEARKTDQTRTLPWKPSSARGVFMNRVESYTPVRAPDGGWAHPEWLDSMIKYPPPGHRWKRW